MNFLDFNTIPEVELPCWKFYMEEIS